MFLYVNARNSLQQSCSTPLDEKFLHRRLSCSFSKPSLDVNLLLTFLACNSHAGQVLTCQLHPCPSLGGDPAPFYKGLALFFALMDFYYCPRLSSSITASPAAGLLCPPRSLECSVCLRYSKVHLSRAHLPQLVRPSFACLQAHLKHLSEMKEGERHQTTSAAAGPALLLSALWG